MREVLAIYNTCGISGRNNTDYYIGVVESLLNQDCVGLQVVWSDCLTSESSRNKIVEHFGKRVSYNFINDRLPLNVTVNATAKKAVEFFGNFQSYLYIDSGIGFGKRNDVSQLVDLLKSNLTYGMVAAQVDSDDGYDVWNIQLEKTIETIIPIGKTVNLHCQLFSGKYFDAYNNIMPDIFAADTSESIFTFLAAAVGLQLVVHPTVRLHHHMSLDSPSVGFGRGNKLFLSPKSHEQLCNEGKPLGYGYEECYNVCNHDPNCYENGFAKNPEPLLNFLKQNVFLSESIFNYNAINHRFIS